MQGRKRDKMSCWRGWPWSLFAAVCFCFCVMAPQPALAIGPYVVEDVAGQKTVLDQATGLEWQQADYGVKSNWQEAIDYCLDLDLGGHTDWRLPYIMELQTIVDYSRYKPAIDTTKFHATSLHYWSSTTLADYANNYALVVDFGMGYDGAAIKFINSFDGWGSIMTRCVRGALDGSFYYLNTGGPYELDGQTVLDQGTGLLWQLADDGKTRTWQQAKDYCEHLDLAGYSDWRLPEIQELKTIVDYSRYNPAIDTTKFKTRSSDYWSSTTHALNASYAWFVNFYYGDGSWNDKTSNYSTGHYFFARCVRGEPNWSFNPLAISIPFPSSDATIGGSTVTITGTGFGDTQGNGTVNIDGLAATILSWAATQITFVAPAHAAGPVDVKVTISSGKTVTAPRGFTYYEDIPPAIKCSTCHGYPPAPLVHTPASTGSLTAGAHAQHIGYYCVDCHNYPSVFGRQIHPSPSYRIMVNISSYGFDPRPDTAQCGDNYGSSGANAYFVQKAVIDNGGNYDYLGTIIIRPDDPRWSPDREMTCANIYCHSQGKRLRQGYDLPSSSPSWAGSNADPQNDGKKCNNCHGYPPSFDSHAYHSSRRFGCELCHAATTTDGRTISDPAKHANFAYDVVPAKAFYARKQWHNLSFVYASTEAGASCSANSCHRYFNYKDEINWSSRRQEIVDAKLSVSQGSCQLPAAGQPLAAETVMVDVRPLCSDCVGPYTCDFDWGDGTADTNVACATTHAYADKIQPPHDPTGAVIGAFDITWTIRDSYGVTLAGCNRTTTIQVCPLPNVAPVVNHKLTAGPDRDAIDICLQDLSLDPDYNLGTHFDPNGVTPGTIRIDWGFSAEQWNDVNEGAITLTDQPSGEVFCHSYPVRGIYTIRHSIRDNHGGQDFVRAPVRRVKVMKDSIQLR